MNDKTGDIGRDGNRKDTAEHSASKAPETRQEAEEANGPSDTRLIPGGAHGSAFDVGMSGMDRDAAISGGRSTGQERYGDTSEE